MPVTWPLFAVACFSIKPTSKLKKEHRKIRMVIKRSKHTLNPLPYARTWLLTLYGASPYPILLHDPSSRVSLLVLAMQHIVMGARDPEDTAHGETGQWKGVPLHRAKVLMNVAQIKGQRLTPKRTSPQCLNPPLLLLPPLRVDSGTL